MNINESALKTSPDSLEGATTIHIKSMHISTLNVAGCGDCDRDGGSGKPGGPGQPGDPGPEPPCGCIVYEDPSDPD